ncbi:MAG: N-acetyltransferase family protein [Ilumatobacteraceae bacterium]
MPVLIRDAVEADMEAVRSIYNATIPTTTVAWTEDLQTSEQRLAWFATQQERGFPVLVAEQDGDVVGFAAYSDFRGAGRWPGYRYTVEHTIHVRERAWGLGVGRALLEELLERARSQGMHVMVGGIDGANESSLRFHERLGFVETARMPEVGIKFGRWLELVFVQKIL